jgi:hypothetical protein
MRALLKQPQRLLWITLALVVLLVWAVNRAIDWSQCAWYGHQTERDTRYAAFVGCMVKVDNNWIPRSELRVVQ